MKHNENNYHASISANMICSQNPGRSALMRPVILGFALFSSSLSLAQQAASQEEFEFSGSLALGAEHNNNLSVTQLESASGQSDTAMTMDANLNLLWKPADKVTLETGYNYTMSRYQDFDSFDLDMHMLFADLAYDFSWVTLGGNYYFADADLGGDDFLGLNQYSFYAGKLIDDAWFLRGALNFTDKVFDVFNARDADTDGFSAEVYRFFNAGRSNVSVGYTRDDEDTRDAAFAYTADTLRLRLNHRFMLGAREARVQLGYRLQDRAYDTVTPVINVPRDDSQSVIDARLEIDLMEKFALVTRWEHGDYRSRLPSADFTDNRVSAALRYSF